SGRGDVRGDEALDRDAPVRATAAAAGVSGRSPVFVQHCRSALREPALPWASQRSDEVNIASLLGRRLQQPRRPGCVIAVQTYAGRLAIINLVVVRSDIVGPIQARLQRQGDVAVFWLERDCNLRQAVSYGDRPNRGL